MSKKKLTGGFAEVSSKPMPVRQSIQPTYDSRQIGDPYYVWTSINGKRIGDQKVKDPFISNRTVISWLDLLKGLFKGKIVVQVDVGTFNRSIVEDVMELDANYLSSNSTRRQDWNGHISQAIQDHVTREMGED